MEEKIPIEEIGGEASEMGVQGDLYICRFQISHFLLEIIKRNETGTDPRNI